MKKLSVLIATVAIVLIMCCQVFATTYEQITVSSTPIGFTASKIKTGANMEAQCALIQINSGGDINFTQDGTTPTTTVGMLLTQGQPMIIYGYANMSAFSAIKTGTTDAVLSCTYFFGNEWK